VSKFYRPFCSFTGSLVGEEYTAYEIDTLLAGMEESYTVKASQVYPLHPDA
jgi:hypothetical protein